MPRHGKKRRIVLNPEEPEVGNSAVVEYNKYHPLHGEPWDVDEMRNELRGLRNHDIKVTFNYNRFDPDTNKEKKGRVSETIRYTRYDDIFGTAGIYASAMHSILEADSDPSLNFTELVIEDYG